MTKRSEIVRMARSWVGTPYRHQGRSARGMDCAGPLIRIAHEIGIGHKFDDELIYSRNPETFSLKRKMDELLLWIEPAEIKPGDILLFRIDAYPQHVSIAVDYYLGGLAMVHCYSRVGKVVEHRLAKIWLARLIQAYKIPGIEEDM